MIQKEQKSVKINQRSQYVIDSAHIAWILLFFSIFSNIIKTGSRGIDAINEANLFRITFVSTAIIISMNCIFMRKNGLAVLFTGPQKWLVIFSALALFSGVYASHGFYAIWKAIEIVAHVLLIGAVLSSTYPEACVNRLFQICLMMFFLLVCLFWIAAIIRPSEAFYYGKGLFILPMSIWPPMDANGVGFVSGFLVLISIARIIDYKRKIRILYIMIILLAGPLFIIAQHRTSLGGFAFGLLFYIYLTRGKSSFIFLTVLIFFLTLAGVNEVLYEYLRRGESDEAIQTVSGRVLAWKAALDYFKESPLIGHGFSSAGRFDVVGSGRGGFIFNGFLDVLIGVGVLGFVPWLLSIISTMWRLWTSAYRSREDEMEIRSNKALAFAILIYLIFRSLTSSGLSYHEFPFLIFDILVCSSWVWTGHRQTVVRPAYL